MSSASGVPKGRKRGPIWDHFADDGPNAKCAVKSDKDKICGHLVKKKVTHNMHDHLERHHKKEYDLYTAAVAKETTKRSNSQSSAQRQPTIQDFVAKQKYSTKHPKQKNFEKEAAWFFGSTNIADKAVESDSYRSMIASCDDQMRPISVTKLLRYQKQIKEQMHKRLMQDLAEAKTIHILSDIWTKRGLTQSYIATCASFYSRRSHKRQVVLLSLELFPNPHTAERILEHLVRTLDDWKIPLHKVGKLISDNGSNYQKAFTKCIQDLVAKQMEEEEAVRRETDDLSDDVEDEDSNDTELMLDPFGLEVEQEEEDEEDEDGEESVLELDQQEKELNAQCAQRQITNMSCFAHNIDLVMRVVEGDQVFLALMALVSQRIGGFWHSTVAKHKIKQLGGKNLLKISKTRWIYRYFFLKNLTDLRQAIDQVCQEQNFDQIQPTEWDQLKLYQDLFEPFAQACGLMVKESGPTISRVISTLFRLKSRLGKLGAKNPILAPLCQQLLSKVDSRFAYVLDEDSVRFDPYFSMATLLDPAVCWTLSESQLSTAKEHVAEYFPKSQTKLAHGVEGEEDDALPAICEELDELGDLYKQRRSEQQKAPVPEPELRASWLNELDHYISVYYHQTIKQKVPDPLDFWHKANQYPSLGDTAVDILSCPPSSAVVERVFSKAGALTSGKRMNLGGKNLESKLIFQINSQYNCN